MAFKQSKRKDDDIAIVNAGLRVIFKRERNNWKLNKASFAFGGVAPITIQPKNTMRKIEGLEWTDKLFKDIIAGTMKELSMSGSTPGGQVEFRMARKNC